MSWSVSGKGTPAEVKEQLVVAFENAKKSTASVEAENKAVRYAEEITNTALDQMIASGYVGVEVYGHGSGCNDGPENTATGEKSWKACMSFNLKIQPLNSLV